MKILVLGAGGVGGYFGGRMVEKGMDVTFLVRPKRAEAIARDGLRIASRYGNAKLAVKTVLQERVKADYDLVMVTAKAYDLASAMDAVAPAMQGGRAQLLPLLNGMAHLQAMDARFGGDRIWGGVAYIAATLAPDGEVRHLNDFNRIAFGARTPAQRAACAAFASELEGVKFDWGNLDNILQAMWDKWVMLATLAGMTCLMRAPVGDIVATGAGEKLMLQILGECAAIAQAEGFPTPEPTMANYRAMVTKKGSEITASMMRDVEQGGAAEGAHVLSALLAHARAKKVEAPLLEIAATHLETYEVRRLRTA